MRFGVLLVLFSSALAINLQDILSKTDKFFNLNRSSDEVGLFENTVLQDLKPVRGKRSVDSAYQEQENRVFRGATKVKYTNYNSPYDLNGFELNGKIYAVSVQHSMPDGGKSESVLLILYKIEEKTSRFLGKIPLIADGAVEVHYIENNVLIAVTHKSRNKNHQGCSIFKIVDEALSFEQFLNTPFPTDVKLATNLKKVYMAISTPKALQIFEWKGRHFDLAQELKLKTVSSFNFFSINGILFLATAHDEEINECSIWEKNLESGVFQCRQYLEPNPSTSVHYFRLRGMSRGEEEHFLIYGYTNDSSVVYKHDGEIFQPFQKIPGYGTVQWFSLQDSESFVLFQLTDKAIPFSYTGWRFVETKVPIYHDSLRIGCKKLRALHKSNEPWLIAINGGIEMAAMMELSFEPQPPKQDTSELNDWCQNQQNQEEAIDTLSRQFQDLPSSDKDLVIDQNLIFRQLKVENLAAEKFQGFSDRLVSSVNEAAMVVDDLRQMMDDVATLSLASFNTITIKGPVEMGNLHLNCDRKSPCMIPNLNTLIINEVPAQDFVNNIVSLSDGIYGLGNLNFETLRARNASSIYFNNNLADSLINKNENLNLENRLFVNGLVTFNGNVFVGGEIQEVVLDREHAVLVDEDQDLDGNLILRSATIENLTIRETINGAKLQELGADMDPNNHGAWDILTVANLTVNGRFAGHPVWKIGKPGNVVKVEDVTIADGKISNVKISDLVRIDEGNYSLQSEITFLQPTNVENLYVTESINQIPLIAVTTASANAQTEPIKLRDVIGDEVIIKGRASVEDIVFENASFLEKMIASNRSNALFDRSADYEQHFSACLDSRKMNENLNGFVQTCVGTKCDTYELEDGVFSVDELVASSLKLSGKINNLNWTEFVDDAVFKGENFTLYGKNSAEGVLNVTDLVIGGLINNETVDEFLNKSHNLVLDDDLTVENLYINGVALLSDEDRNDSLILSNVNFVNGIQLETINDVEFTPFVENVAYINESTKLGIVDFLKIIEIDNLTNYDLLNGANFYQSVVLKNSSERQVIEGQWLFQKNLVIDGELIVHGQVNGMDLTVLCQMSQKPPKVIVGGSVKTSVEPIVTKMINQFDMDVLFDDLWFKNEPTVLKENVNFSNTSIEGNVKLEGNLNGIKLENLAKGYLSKSIPRRMLAPIKIRNLTSLGMVRASNITGVVNGLNLGKFAPNVLQYGVKQTFTGRPQFHELVISELGENSTINGLDLRSDVLRYSTEAEVTGLKTVREIVTDKLTIPAGKLLQGVDFDSWTREAVLKGSDVIYGDINFQTVEIENFINVTGTIGGIKFDKQHLLRVNGNQTVTGKKRFAGDLFIESLKLDGAVNGIDLNNLLQNSAYSDRDVSLKSPTEIQNIQANNLELSGELAGVNVTNFCSLAKNRVNIDNLSTDYSKLLNAASDVHQSLSNEPYYLDHYELVQKFGRNVSGIVNLPQSATKIIAVFRKFGFNNNVTLMAWDSHDKVFRAKKDLTHPLLSGNTSLITSGRNHILVETWKQGAVLFYKDLQVSLNKTQATCAAPFELPSNKICLFLGQVGQPDSLMCGEIDHPDLAVVQTFEATHCAQATSVTTTNETWLAVIGAKPSRPAKEWFVTVFSKTEEEEKFRPRQDLPVLHPVSVSATVHGLFSYLVVASQHQPESVRSSLLAIFRFSIRSNKWTRYQEISVEAPRFVSFEHLPTGQLALYVLTDNPARAFLVFLYRGVEGFVEETAGLAVHPGKFLSSFVDENKHFVGIAGDGFSQLLEAHFMGRPFG